MAQKTVQKNVVHRITTPFQRFFETEASGGILLIFSAFTAMIWANSPFQHAYHELWEGTHLSVGVGSFSLDKSLHHWINDGLMAVFFFLVGLEIKREILVGELSTLKKAAMPFTAAVGGMLIPAAFFLVYMYSVGMPDLGADGWGVVVATDIAFSLGVLNLFGSRVPLSLKVFLTAFAIFDDIGAVLIIAVFYTEGLQLDLLLMAAGIFGFGIFLNKLKVYNLLIYLLIGIVMWYLFLKSGVHTTVAGVLVAFLIPAKRKIAVGNFVQSVKSGLLAFQKTSIQNKVALSHEQLDLIDEISSASKKVQSPLQKLEYNLHGFVIYFVMPVFALSNAGITVEGDFIAALTSNLSLGIFLGLVVGKVLGIVSSSWLADKIGIASLPEGFNIKQLVALGFLGGIGFTMSLFIVNLAFTDQSSVIHAKVGILFASLAAVLGGYFMLSKSLPKAEDM